MSRTKKRKCGIQKIKKNQNAEEAFGIPGTEEGQESWAAGLVRADNVTSGEHQESAAEAEGQHPVQENWGQHQKEHPQELAVCDHGAG